MSLSCLQCHEKQELIAKYVKLIKLLKTKCQKTSKSMLKNQTFSSESFLQRLQQTPKSILSNGQSSSIKSELNVVQQNPQQENMYKFQLAFSIISNKSKRSLLKHGFNNLQAAAKISKSKEKQPTDLGLFSFNITSSLTSFIQQTISNGQELQSQSQSNSFHAKQLHLKIFNLQLKNSQFMKKICRLEKQVFQSQKRFLKQTQKKRQSLETVAQQIRQKTQMIGELHQIIKRYEKSIGKSLQKISVQNVLIQDEEELKKTCLRLQNINQKLNCDIRNAQSNIQKLSSQLSISKNQISILKIENKNLKELNFDLSQQISKSNQLGKTYRNLCVKFNKKMEKLKIREKQVYQRIKINSKCGSLFSSVDIVSTKNTESSQLSPLSRKSSLKQFQNEQRIQEMFSFLFNIEVEDYKINNEDLFDQDQLNLLKTHKNSYLNSISNQNPQTKVKNQKLIKNNNLNQTDEIFYLQSPQLNIQNSFLNALDSKTSQFYPQQVQNVQFDNMKLIDLEIQKSKLVQKISDLKNLHMHIRNVIYNFLKSLDLNNSKNQAQSILQIIFDFFQYSEDERQCIFRQKKKKFWGIL